MTGDSAVTDVVLIGGGIMSATLATLLAGLEPDWRIRIFERLDDVAQESSAAWNNAGTGHAALCELNYTPAAPDGSVAIDRAVAVSEQFHLSRQLWASLVRKGQLPDPASFITAVPHMSFVQGTSNVAFLRKRYEALKDHPLFSGMRFSDNPDQLRQWMPLVMNGRTGSTPLAATWSDAGSDVNFGALTRHLFASVCRKPTVSLHTGHEVTDLSKEADGLWTISVRRRATNQTLTLRSRFVFIGAGGAALTLLQKAGLPEAAGTGGFPVSGQFLVCKRPEIVAAHRAKVYGKAAVGAPPMSVPHLDTRVIEGKPALLFGPYAGFSTRFLKQGSLLDLPRSIHLSNLRPMLAVARDNWPLTRYLIEQVMQSHADRMKALRDFIPDARDEDWSLTTAGQRVQIIRADRLKGGVLRFGTEVIHAADGSAAALLGASPGASTAASAMLTVLERCFPNRIPGWSAALRDLIPSYGQSLAASPELCAKVRAETAEILKLGD